MEVSRLDAVFVGTIQKYDFSKHPWITCHDVCL